jgi:hypothetical protein
MNARAVSSLVALACLALSPLSFAEPVSRGADELKGQLQDLRMRIKQEAAKSESDLTAVQRSVLKERVAQAAPEVARIRADIRALAARLRVTLRPGLADRLAADRATLLTQADQSAEELLAIFMKLDNEDDAKKGDAEAALRAIYEALHKVHIRITLDSSSLTPRPTPKLTPRPSHD